MRTEIRPTDDLKQLSNTVKRLPGKAHFGLLMYAEGLRDRYEMAGKKPDDENNDRSSATD